MSVNFLMIGLPIQPNNREYSGLSLLRAITTANGQEVYQLARVWVHGIASGKGGDSLPFLFINEGAATVSGSALGVAVIRDTVTNREVQLLKHTGIVHVYNHVAGPDCRVSDR